jgi:hypothetical protein
MNKVWQVALIGVVVVYAATRILSFCGTPHQSGNGFEFSIAKHHDDTQATQWSVKMSAGTFDLNLKWNP